ncbi:amidohydrolase [Pigmentiphaga sp. NML080357]|uniref:amidohydrolase family protein n=1 Tax=Pigmentiphaga sp. NML080357 TaxID=2008675 RepID=UPI000B41FE2A|nr:amidohydrolase family protein [Pigmentiphaga sp. NML080357]OVZ56621.1 amidohydrolase [Pigmentiphaga sp. NML080357]
MSFPKPTSIIDLHTHVIADDQDAYPLAPLAGKQSDWSRERPVTYPAMLAAMDDAGIAKVALVQASTCYGHDNRYVADSVAARPDRFIGIYSIGLTDEDAAERIAYWHGRGLHGMRVFIAGHTAADRGARLDDPRGFPAWERAQELDIPVCVQLRADGLPQLENVLQRFPRVRVLLDHFARPRLDDGPPYAAAASLFGLARHANLFFKLTTHNVREAKEGAATQASFLRQAVDAFGADRIAWGSNFPASAGSLVALLGEALEATASLSDEEREWIFHRTAKALYPALGAAGGRA